VAAQGGISASLGNMHEDDWRPAHVRHRQGSDWLGDQDAIEYMVRNAREAVYSSSTGAYRSRAPRTANHQRPFGMTIIRQGPAQHLRRRRPHRHAMLHTMYGQSLRHSAEFFEFFAIDLIMDHQGVCRGVVR
jgi:succinate dehydrogenase / fumarate reductase flavoprotein subunit